MNTIKAITAALAGSLLLATPAFALSVPAGIDGTIQLAAPNISVPSDISDQTQSSTTDASADAPLPLVLTQQDIPSKGASDVSASSSISTRQQLSDFIASRLRADPSLLSVDTAPDHVAVTYLEPGTFWNVFLILVDTTVTTDASANISITHPWWQTLSDTEENDLQSRTQTAVTAVLGLSPASSAQLSLSQQAQLEFAIETAMALGAGAN